MQQKLLQIVEIKKYYAEFVECSYDSMEKVHSIRNPASNRCKPTWSPVNSKRPREIFDTFVFDYFFGISGACMHCAQTCVCFWCDPDKVELCHARKVQLHEKWLEISDTHVIANQDKFLAQIGAPQTTNTATLQSPQKHNRTMRLQIILATISTVWLIESSRPQPYKVSETIEPLLYYDGNNKGINIILPLNKRWIRKPYTICY